MKMVNLPPDPPPTAPEGCVYGPWWDAAGKRWFCLDPALNVLSFGTRTHEWWFDGLDFTDEITNELLRLAKENAELTKENANLKNQVKNLESLPRQILLKDIPPIHVRAHSGEDPGDWRVRQTENPK